MAEERMRESFTLTTEHKQVLAAIGASGGTDKRLRGITFPQILLELEHAGYIWRDIIEVDAGTRIWYLTDLGATSVGIDPGRIYRR